MVGSGGDGVFGKVPVFDTHLAFAAGQTAAADALDADTELAGCLQHSRS